MILYCRNDPVFNTDNEKIYDLDLLPGMMKMYPRNVAFREWYDMRRCPKSNLMATDLLNQLHSLGCHQKTDYLSYGLSLNDTYWVKEEGDDTPFEAVSPYYVPVWTRGEPYSGQPLPTLYTTGHGNKEWIDALTLRKYTERAREEYLALKLCEACSVPCARGTIFDGGIDVMNITNPRIMLEQADISGRIDPDDYSLNVYVEKFGLAAITMATVDAVVANADRHPGNVGWYRSTETGEYLCMAPLYDFEHAFDSELSCDAMIYELEDILKQYDSDDYYQEAARICRSAIKADVHPLFTARASELVSRMKKSLHWSEYWSD